MNANDDLEKRLPSAASEATPNLEPEAQEIPMGSLETQVCKPESFKTSLESGSPSLRIGNYKLLQLIGEGGMGAVWMADQTEPVKRRVALKLIKTGTDTKPIIARFEAERQALALMDHPSIAKILDGGTTESGQPYFVMELVTGIPITQYCDKHRLSLPERLGLFTQVCNAIQHAHQKGIIHRDLKPANILVGVYDGQPVPKVIDFGLAKALDHQSKLTDKTLFTEFGAVVGTLQYMSPEQADLDAVDIDTRADIYALGVLLYELLTGSTPIEVATLKQLALLKVLETIRDTDPPRPSARLSSSSHQLPAISGNRQIDPARLQSELRGDLDWIVMKALEKDRSRRYESASGFAADIERYLTDQPVVARPPTTVYKLGKFFKKNRGPVIAAGTMFLLLLAGLVGTSIGLLEATRQTKRAEKNLARAETAETETKQRVKDLEEITAFQTSQLSDIDVPMMGVNLRRSLLDQFQSQLTQSGKSEGEVASQVSDLEQKFSRVNFVDASLDLLEENVFKRAEKVIEDEYKEKPLLAAALLHAVGVTRRELGRIESAEGSLRKEVELRTNAQGPEHLDTLRAKNSLAVSLNASGNATEAETLYREALESYRRAIGSEDPRTLTSITNLAAFLDQQGESEEAGRLHSEALETGRRILGNDHPDTTGFINNMAFHLYAKGELAEAELLARESLTLNRRIQGNEHPETINSMNSLAVLLDARGKATEAEPVLRKALEVRRQMMGNEHPDTLTSINNLAMFLFGRKQFVESETLLSEGLKYSRQILGNEHPVTLTYIQNLAGLYEEQGKWSLAESLQNEALDGRRRILGNEHPDTLSSMNNVGTSYYDQSKWEEAEPFLRLALEGRRRTLGNEHPDTLSSISNFASLLGKLRMWAEAEPLWREAIRGLTDSPESKRSRLTAITQLASLLNNTNRSKEAIQLLGEYRNDRDPRVFIELAEAYRQAEQPDEGLKLVEEFVDRTRRVNSKTPKAIAISLWLAARALNRMEEFSRAEPLARESLALATNADVDGWELERIRLTLGVSLLGVGQREEARSILESSCEAIVNDAAKIPIEVRAVTVEEAKAAVAKLNNTEP